MNKIAVKAAKIFTETSIECEKYLLIEDDKFAGLVAKDNLPSDITVKDFSNFHILPGLIDTHIHGAVGYDTMDSTPEAVQNIGDYLLSQGTTAWMPTTVTAPQFHRQHPHMSGKIKQRPHSRHVYRRAVHYSQAQRRSSGKIYSRFEQR